MFTRAESAVSINLTYNADCTINSNSETNSGMSNVYILKSFSRYLTQHTNPTHARTAH